MAGKVPIPPEVPEGFKCIQVWYPDTDPMLYALKGALFPLSKSYYWESDVPGLPQVIAQSWLLANIQTDENTPCDCEDCEECEQVIVDESNYIAWLEQQLEACQECIKELECKMCGCCGENNNQTNPAQMFDPSNYGDLIEELTRILCSEDFPIDDTKCRAINWTFDSWIQFIEELENASGTGELSQAVITRIVLAAEWTLKTRQLVIAFAVAVLSYIRGITTGATRRYLEANRTEIISIIYNSASPYLAKDNFIDHVGQDSSASNLVTYILYAMANLGDWNVIYDGTLNVPEDYDPETPCIVAAPVAPTGYVLVPMPVTTGGVNNGMTETATDHECIFSWDNTSNPFGPTGSVTLAKPASPLGYLVQVTSMILDANVTAIKWDFQSSVSIPSLDIAMFNESAPFDVRGRISAETGLSTWVADVPAALQDNSALIVPRDNFELRVTNVSSQVIIGSLTARFYAVIAE